MVLLPLGKKEEGGGVGVDVRVRSRVKKVGAVRAYWNGRQLYGMGHLTAAVITRM